MAQATFAAKRINDREARCQYCYTTARIEKHFGVSRIADHYDNKYTQHLCAASRLEVE